MLLLELPLDVGFLMPLEEPEEPEELAGREEVGALDEAEEPDLPRPETMSCAERPEEAEEDTGAE